MFSFIFVFKSNIILPSYSMLLCFILMSSNAPKGDRAKISKLVSLAKFEDLFDYHVKSQTSP